MKPLASPDPLPGLALQLISEQTVPVNACTSMPKASGARTATAYTCHVSFVLPLFMLCLLHTLRIIYLPCKPFVFALLFNEDCDGASFSGFRAGAWPATPAVRMATMLTTPDNTLSGQRLHFRGLANLDATLDELVAVHGLGNASEVVVTGTSAGGLSTILHVDRIAARILEAKAATRAVRGKEDNLKVRGVPVVGGFLDHGNIRNDEHNYTAWMRSVVEMQNISHSGALAPSCIEAHKSDERFKCFLAPYALPFVNTPVFLVNSKYDAWQLNNELQLQCLLNKRQWPGASVSPDITCTETEKHSVVEYGADWLSSFPRMTLLKGGHGAFITSCVCHGCPWEALSLDGSANSAGGSNVSVSTWKAVARWYGGEDTAAAALRMDLRGPNGDGAIPSTKGCLLVQGCCQDVMGHSHSQ